MGVVVTRSKGLHESECPYIPPSGSPQDLKHRGKSIDLIMNILLRVVALGTYLNLDVRNEVCAAHCRHAK